MGEKQAAQGKPSQMFAHLLNAGFQTQAILNVDYEGKIQTRGYVPGSVSKKLVLVRWLLVGKSWLEKQNKMEKANCLLLLGY